MSHPIAPIIEIARKNQRLIPRDAPRNRGEDEIDLALADPLGQAQVNAERVHAAFMNFEHSVEQAATLETVHRHVVIADRMNRKAGQNGVAMVSMLVDGIAPVVHLRPVRAGQVISLVLFRPVGEAPRVTRVTALYFLQEHDIRAQCVEFMLEVMHDKSPIEWRQALVHVEAGNGKRVRHVTVGDQETAR